MTRKPLLHAFFHSVASLGYIPFALSSVLLSSSSPFVSIPPIIIILIAFIPPLLMFPILCFSYRFLERFECISLTVQRARTYVMMAGSGLCMLVAIHLLMVSMVGNGHNSLYNRMVHDIVPAMSGEGTWAIAKLGSMTPPAPSGLVLDSAMVEPLRIPQQNHASSSSASSASSSPATDFQVPAPSPTASTSLPQEAEDVLPLPSSIISSLFKSLPTSELGPGPELSLPAFDLGGPDIESYLNPLEEMFAEIERIEASAGFSVEAAADEESLRMIGSRTRRENTDAIGDEIFVAMSRQDLSRNKGPNVVLPLANRLGGGEGRGVVSKSPVPMHLYPNAPASALEVSSPTESEEQLLPPQQLQEESELSQQNKRDSVVAGQMALKIGGQEDEPIGPPASLSSYPPPPTPPATPPSLGMPALDPISIILMSAQQIQQQKQQEQQEQQQQQQQQPEEPLLPLPKPSYFPPSITAVIAASSANPQTSIIGPRNPNKTLGYNLAGVHWLLYLFSQAFLIFLLFTLFLGVLILTEFVLDREDDDLVHIQHLYWSRVVGIASATIVSAVHGSLLSGYVLLEEHTDWIAKAAVGAIVVYWVGMTWIMNRMTGPLPY